MARQTFSVGDAGSQVRAVIDSNFTELYDTYLPKAGGDLTGPLDTTIATQNRQIAFITGNNLTLSLSGCSFFTVTLSSSINSITLNNVPASPKVFSFNLQFIYNSDTSYTVNWTGTGNYRWSSGIAPTLTCLNNKSDLFTFLTYDGGVNWFAFVSDQNQ
jgi:hypothetical protein